MNIEPLVIPAAISTGMKIAGGISTALSSLKTARELAKQSHDSELKNELSDVYNSLLELREALHDLQTENEGLRKQLEQRATLTRQGEFGYYFAQDDTDPFCPLCYERDGKLIHLDPADAWSEAGQLSRYCSACKRTAYERRSNTTTRLSLPYDPFRKM